MRRVVREWLLGLFRRGVRIERRGDESDVLSRQSTRGHPSVRGGSVRRGVFGSQPARLETHDGYSRGAHRLGATARASRTTISGGVPVDTTRANDRDGDDGGRRNARGDDGGGRGRRGRQVRRRSGDERALPRRTRHGRGHGSTVAMGRRHRFARAAQGGGNVSGHAHDGDFGRFQGCG